MGNLYPQHWAGYLGVFQIFLRLLGLFMLVPGFSHRSIPTRMKILMALVISLALYPLLRVKLGSLPPDLWSVALVVLRESAIGLIMGFTAYITFEAISLAAHFVGTQMGFGVGGLMDPVNGSQASVMVPLHAWILLMMFLLLDMHHQMIKLFVLSYDTAPGFELSLSSPGLLAEFVRISGKIFILAVQMAAPFTLLFFACNLAIGMLARLLPQMNIMLFSFPITIMLGLGFLYVIAPEVLDYCERVLGEMTTDVALILKEL